MKKSKAAGGDDSDEGVRLKLWAIRIENEIAARRDQEAKA